MNQDKVRKLIAESTQIAGSICSVQRYSDFLHIISRFPKYNLYNCLLLTEQRPDATYVTDFDTWKLDFERHVRKGEKGIRLLKYAGAHDKEILTEGDASQCELLYVYDISQTVGDNKPQFKTQSSRDDIITVLNKCSRIPAFAWNDTLQDSDLYDTIREIARAEVDLMYGQTINYMDYEMQTDSSAYILCEYLNMDCSEYYTFSYIEDWKKERDTAEIQRNLSIIRQVAYRVIERIDKELKGMQRANKIAKRLDVRIEEAKATADMFNRREKSVIL